jgi:UDP-N-acetylglucosamine transferase subunit ALG13
VSAADTRPPRVLVTVGTDHHPFDRLIGWVNGWLEQHPEHADSFFVQSGTASLTPACPTADFLDTHRLGELLDQADVLVCHGGPASIADAWRRGHVPIVVPRLRSLHEHVDDHQLDFCVKVAELGHVRLARTAEEFANFIGEVGEHQHSVRVSRPAGDIDAAVVRFGALVDELVSRPRRRPSLLNLFRRQSPGQGEFVTEDSGPAVPQPRDAVSGISGSWRAARSPAGVGLAGVPKEEQE